MKNLVRHTTIFALIILALTSCGSAGQFSSLKGIDNVDVVHIPRGLMMMTRASAGKEGATEARMMKSVKSMDVVHCGNSKARQRVMDAAAEARKADKSELIMRVVEGREVTEIYGTVDEKKNTLGNILIITEDAANLSVVRLRGNFNLSDVINSNSKKVHFFTNEPNHSSLIESTSPN